MARKFNNSSNKKGFGRGKKKGSRPASSDKTRFTEKPVGKLTEKKGFNPNEDLTHGKESYAVKKRKNLLDKDKKKSHEKSSYSKAEKQFEKPKGSYDRGEGAFAKKSGRRSESKLGRFAKKTFLRTKKTEGNTPFNKPFGSYSEENDSKLKGRFIDSEEKPFRKNTIAKSKGYEKKPGGKRFIPRTKSLGYKKLSEQDQSIGEGLVRLNKYIANAGICSRREADELILAGTVSVNGKVVTEMGYKVKVDDKISYGGETLRKEKLVYVLLNKPKDFITTLNDPSNRKTVFDLVRNACKERIYPVGRLDRNTTGVLLLTNDGDLTKKLTHPKHGIKKIYLATLDKPLTRPDFDEIATNGVTLEDGHIKPDTISYAGDGSNKKEIGLEIHSGRNRIVRRLFEQLGYTVEKLDRVVFAGLTKKDLPRGNWRLLSPKEVAFLKMLG